MNNDLISREALKKALTNAHINMALTFDISTFNYVMNTIDNAPTVAKRPQGEWIYPEKTDKEKGYGGYCSNCKCDMPIFVEDWKQKYCETKFCPNCGAKMKGGAL